MGAVRTGPPNPRTLCGRGTVCTWIQMSDSTWRGGALAALANLTTRRQTLPGLITCIVMDIHMNKDICFRGAPWGGLRQSTSLTGTLPPPLNRYLWGLMTGRPPEPIPMGVHD